MQTELRLGQILSTMTDMDRFASFSTQVEERGSGRGRYMKMFSCHWREKKGLRMERIHSIVI